MAVRLQTPHSHFYCSVVIVVILTLVGEVRPNPVASGVLLTGTQDADGNSKFECSNASFVRPPRNDGKKESTTTSLYPGTASPAPPIVPCWSICPPFKNQPLDTVYCRNNCKRFFMECLNVTNATTASLSDATPKLLDAPTTSSRNTSLTSDEEELKKYAVPIVAALSVCLLIFLVVLIVVSVLLLLARRNVRELKKHHQEETFRMAEEEANRHLIRDASPIQESDEGNLDAETRMELIEDPCDTS